MKTNIKIISAANSKIKDLIKLRDHRSRVRTGLTIIDGIREVRCALKAGIELKEIYICPELYAGQTKGSVPQSILRDMMAKAIPIFEVTADLFEKICFGDRAEGLLAVGQCHLQQLADLTLSKNPLLMLIEGVEKPGNLGAILRTCDAAGIEALLVCDLATDIFNPNVIRASLGTVFSVPVVQASPEVILTFLKKHQVRIFAATPAAKKVYTQGDFAGAVVLAFGSEKVGLSDFWLNSADEKVFIPMKGQVDSLNTSVSAALVAYEAIRQRQVGP